MQLGKACRTALVLVCAVALFACDGALGDTRMPRMGIFTTPGAQLDLANSFTDSTGVRGTLRSFTRPQRPILLVPVFYRCPRLCGLTLAGVKELVGRMKRTIGEDYSLVVYSFNPDDTSEDAAAKREVFVSGLNLSPQGDAGVKFLVGDRGAIERINEQLGFRVRYADRELEHSSAIFIVSPHGTVGRYFAGIEFEPQAVARALQAL